MADTVPTARFGKLPTLRCVALIGLAVVLLVDFILSWRVQGGLVLGVVMLLLFPVAVGLVSLLLMPKSVGALFRNLDLLVPLGLVMVADKLLDWLAAAPVLGALLTPSLPLHFFSLSLSLSLSLLLRLALDVAYATWMTSAVLELVRSGEGDPCRTLPAVPGRFLRMLGLECIGYGLFLAGTTFLLCLLPMLSFFALVLLLVFGVAWNFATAAVLPLVWQNEAGVWSSFRNGVAVSRANLRKWWLLLLAQMLLMGLVFFYIRLNGGGTNMNWSVNVFWTGAYEDSCRWYGKLAEVFHTTKLPLVETLLTLLFGTLAVAVKIAIVQRLQPEPPLREQEQS